MKVKCLFDKMVSVDELKAHPKNHNKHPADQIKMLVKILKFQGWRYPVKVSKLSVFVTSGHGRIEAARSAGWKTVPVNFQDYDDEAQEYADVQADNSVALWAEMDLSSIASDIVVFGPNFDRDWLGIKDFTIDVADEEPGCDEDEVPEHVEPDAKLGGLYKLGQHRLLCGDSTDILAVEKLMDGEKADITFTSPPYNAGKTPKDDGKYLNDDDDKDAVEYLDFLCAFTSVALTVSSFVFVNIQSISGNKISLIEFLYRMKEVYADTIIWDKTHAAPAMAKNVLNSQFEYVHIFSEKANRSVGTVEFRGTLKNILTLPSSREKNFASIHKATFPVAFAEHFVENFCSKSVYEPFGGSGSTLIACEKTKRRCFMMELDPHYIDVIVGRWEKYTGGKAELLNGTT